ncbi:MAG: cryptochrome/photolyase family protein [Chitinophagaceae bacterium]|nr:cryptochrome/photolyase family protein [Oligoflexus sp.]
MKALLILGDQLFSPAALSFLKPGVKSSKVFMREDRGLATHYRYHKHKLILFFTAMRDYADELTAAGYSVHYEKLGDKPGSYEESFEAFIVQNAIQSLEYFEIQDAFFESRIHSLIARLGLAAQSTDSPMFLTSRPMFKAYLDSGRTPFMKTFYESQRRRLKVLVDEDGKPEGGRWSFDEDNRLKLPADLIPPHPPKPPRSRHLADVMKLIDEHFADHPGESKNFWLPTNRKGARLWLDDFVQHRLKNFGPYEDALPVHSPFVFHSILTPFLNTGLLTPAEVIKAAIAGAAVEDVPLNSLEGFIRQICGWREFVRGIYQNFRIRQETTNFWDHRRKLSRHWYEGTTGVEPLDLTIQKCRQFGYAHHIERLMVVGSLMLLLEVDPHEAHRWFMEMFIDSADWVMGPNVYGMALFSDGGIFATKPYICGSNYYRKMGPFKGGEWQDGVDGLYWGFISKNRGFFAKNPRMAFILGSLNKMKPERLMTLHAAAESLRERLTIA